MMTPPKVKHKRKHVTALRSPLMKTLDRSVILCLIKISFVHFHRYFNRYLCSRPDFTRFDSVRVENGAKKSQKVVAFTRIEIM